MQRVPAISDLENRRARKGLVGSNPTPSAFDRESRVAVHERPAWHLRLAVEGRARSDRAVSLEHARLAERSPLVVEADRRRGDHASGDAYD